jgi:hypothetical protein
MARVQKVSEQLPKVIDKLAEITEMLFDCSRESATSESNEWHAAETLFNLAKSADSLRRQAASLMNGSSPTRSSGGSSKESVAKGVPGSARIPKKRKDDYPKYRVKGSLMIKTGLGRDRKSEYEHIVPKAEFERILDSVSVLVSSNREFNAEDVHQTLDCPMYQTYAVLALLRHLELLDMPRRGSYLGSVENPPFDATSVWNMINHA